MAIKALMVDVDGVLIDGRPQDGKHWATGLEDDLGIQSDILQREFFQVHWEDIVVGRATLKERLIPALKKIAPAVTADRFIAYWFQQDSRINRDLLEELTSLRTEGIQVFLATNQEHMRARYLMQDLGLSKMLDGIYYSAQLGVKKPDHAFFTRICTHRGLRPTEVVLIDDSLKNVTAAAEVGWHSVNWKNTDSLRHIRALIGRERNRN